MSKWSLAIGIVVAGLATVLLPSAANAKQPEIAFVPPGMVSVPDRGAGAGE